jgi:hypothetical protein
MNSQTLFAPETELQNELTYFNRSRLTPSVFSEDWKSRLELEIGFRLREGEMVEKARAEIAPLLRNLPIDPPEFMQWFESLRESGPGQHDPLFPWLEHQCGYEQMRWFIEQEVAGEAGFEDLVAYTQVKMPTRAKLELARNYWDEMGRGGEKGMHGPMLAKLAKELGIDTKQSEIVPEALALGNLMVALATNRHFAFQSIGCLGAVELTAPDRARAVHQGLKRLGVTPVGQRYYLLHSTLDEKHSESWNTEVIRPLVTEHPETMRPIAEGALMRLNAGAKCFLRYRAHLWKVGLTTMPKNHDADPALGARA